MRLKSGPEKQPEDAIRDIRPATRPRAEFGLIQRQADNPAADSLWDAVPGRIRPSGTIREAFRSDVLMAITPEAVERNAELFHCPPSGQVRSLDYADGLCLVGRVSQSLRSIRF
jgi:hypothetical protein